MSVDAKKVKHLRDKKGAGIMDCKKALVESSGDMEKAVDYLRKTGITKAEKKSARIAKEGLIYSYIHQGNRLGVLLDIGCETDFVAKTEGFKDIAHNISMQIAATNPIAIRREDVDPELTDREKSIVVDANSNEKRLKEEKNELIEIDSKYYETEKLSNEDLENAKKLLILNKIPNDVINIINPEEIDKIEDNSLDFVFTSPPYFGWEAYGDEPEQSSIKFSTSDIWKEKFLKQTIANAYKGLKTGKYLALNVANTKQYKTFEEDTVALAKEVGFEHTDTWWLALSTQQGGPDVATLDGNVTEKKQKQKYMGEYIRPDIPGRKFEPTFIFKK